MFYLLLLLLFILLIWHVNTKKEINNYSDKVDGSSFLLVKYFNLIKNLKESPTAEIINATNREVKIINGFGNYSIEYVLVENKNNICIHWLIANIHSNSESNRFYFNSSDDVVYIRSAMNNYFEENKYKIQRIKFM